MSARDKRQHDGVGPLITISDEDVFLSAPVLNPANDNQQGAQLIPAPDGEDSVTWIEPEFRRSRGVVFALVCAITAFFCVASWLYVVSMALLDNVNSFVH